MIRAVEQLTFSEVDEHLDGIASESYPLDQDRVRIIGQTMGRFAFDGDEYLRSEFERTHQAAIKQANMHREWLIERGLIEEREIL